MRNPLKKHSLHILKLLTCICLLNIFLNVHSLCITLLVSCHIWLPLTPCALIAEDLAPLRSYIGPSFLKKESCAYRSDTNVTILVHVRDI